MSAWRRRLAQEPDHQPSLPLRPGPASNGEFLPPPRTSADRALERAALDRAALAADRIGVDRRRFLQTAGGVAAVLATYNLAACSSDGGGGGSAAPNRKRGPTTSNGQGGSFEVPEPEDLEACGLELSGGGEFIFDIHTHTSCLMDLGGRTRSESPT